MKFELGLGKCPLPGGETALGFTQLKVGKGPRRGGANVDELRPSAVALQQPPGGPLARDSEVGRSSNPGGRRRERDHAPSASRARLP